MAATPKQVAKQLKEIEALEQQLYGEPQAAVSPVPPSPDTNPPVQPVAAPSVESPTTEATPPVPEAPPSEEPRWEQKYRTLQGMFQAEVPRLQQQNKDLLAQVQGMQAEIAKLKQPEDKPQPLVTDKDKETFGEDLISVMERVTRQVMQEHVTPLRSELHQRDQRVAQLEQALHKTSGDVTALSFEQQLRLVVPDFDQVNADAKWIAWLDQVDPFTGEPRRSYAEFVYGQGNVEKVKQIVDLFRAQHAPSSTARKQEELKMQVQPSRTSPTPSGASETKMYSEQEANLLWDRIRRLNVSGKYEDANRLETDLTRAYVEGRIAP